MVLPWPTVITLASMKYRILLESQIVDLTRVFKSQLIPPFSFCEWGSKVQEGEAISLRRYRVSVWQSPG